MTGILAQVHDLGAAGCEVGREETSAIGGCNSPSGWTVRALAHHASLGIATKAYAGSDDCGYAERDGTRLYVTVQADLDPLAGASSA